MTNYYDHYSTNPRALADACDRGAGDLRREAAEALTAGDQSRHDRKQRAADFVDSYAKTVRDGTANLDHAQIVAHASNMSGILIDGPMPDDPNKHRFHPEELRAEQELAAKRKAELSSAAEAGLVSRVDDPGQVAFYALSGYEPDGYDPQTYTTDLRDRAVDETGPHTAVPQAWEQTSELNDTADDADGM